VLRNRLRASKGLVAYVLSLEQSDELFPASPSLATTSKPARSTLEVSSAAETEPQGYRTGKQIFDFLRVRGARLRGVPVDLHWLEEESGRPSSNGEQKKDR
jgi:hypothetical protein